MNSLKQNLQWIAGYITAHAEDKASRYINSRTELPKATFTFEVDVSKNYFGVSSSIISSPKPSVCDRITKMCKKSVEELFKEYNVDVSWTLFKNSVVYHYVFKARSKVKQMTLEEIESLIGCKIQIV